MELNEQDIAQIEAYLLGDGTADERAAFEQRLQSDSEFAQEYKVYKQLHQGITNHARQAFKANIGALGAKVIAKGSLSTYKPKIKPGGGGGIGNGLFKIMALGVGLTVGGYWAGSTYLVPQESQEEVIEVIESDSTATEEQQPAPEIKKETEVKYDTQKVTVVRQRTLMITADGDTVEVDGTAEDAIEKINSTEGVEVDSVYTIKRVLL